eukprot:CAMPEP_0184287872 /NCGR_PEP_ID=MMETSP1049-20130417/280_1 /TAXON_ID=77928 /ORGANISM="Proteomonas sulcata, Strain CCMP704" /LENGTH=69 /DNA_ID=CAMNT_0026593975 /DNA_START=1950 /DNA_END=2160 /DNA_ORIENTATION=+
MQPEEIIAAKVKPTQVEKNIVMGLEEKRSEETDAVPSPSSVALAAVLLPHTPELPGAQSQKPGLGEGPG